VTSPALQLHQSTPAETDKLLARIDEFAAALSISVRSAKRIVAIDGCPGIVRPYGRAVRFDMAKVKKWIADGCPRHRGRRK